jgi:hypothetical protein
VEVWNDEHFSRLREFHGVTEWQAMEAADTTPQDGVRSQRSSFDLKTPRQEGVFGKGGHHQYLSSCGMFICKSLADCDHESLLRRTEAYVNHLLTGDSFIVPFYVHFRDPVSSKNFVIMRNVAPTPSHLVRDGRGYWDFKYDLKGCDDDKTLEEQGKIVRPVRRRWYRIDRWFKCCWTPPRWHYWQFKEHARKLTFSFPPSQQQDIVRRIKRDSEWLIEQGLMDYSLFLAVREAKPGQEPSADSGAVKQYAMAKDQDRNVVVVMGIIDFLQPWTASKKVAQCIKSLEFNKATIPPKPYGERFARHFASRFKADASLKAL